MQSSELENAYKQTVQNHQQYINSNLINNLPMMEDKISDHLKQLKSECLTFFKSNTLGDISNTKNQHFINKLKKEFKVQKEQLLKKNRDIATKECNFIIDHIFQLSVMQKMQQGMYTKVSDLYADLKYVETEFQNQVESKYGIKDMSLVK